MTIDGLAASNPITSNATDEGRAGTHRVEVTLGKGV